MEDRSLSKLGGTCSILLGISYIVVAVTYLTQPEGLQSAGDPIQFIDALVEGSILHTILHWTFALGAALGLIVVPAISNVVRDENKGWVTWGSNLALLGFAVTAIWRFRALVLEPILATEYAAGDTSLRASIVISNSLVDIDPYGWLGYGAIGTWLLVVSILTLRVDGWPKTLSYLGIVGAAMYWLLVVGYELSSPSLIMIASMLGGVIIGPIWYIWAGAKLRKAF